jgi:hypothetical protein
MSTKELLEYLDSKPFKFWVCRNCPGSEIAWSGKTATCLTCGQSSNQTTQRIECKAQKSEG